MSNQYKATILADSPIRYYRLNETSGTVANDLGSQAQNGTLIGGITLNQAGVITGDTTDASMLFNGSTGYIDLPITGLPIGNASWSMECWIKTPGTIVSGDLMGFGNQGTTQIWWLDSRSGAFDLRQWSGADVVGGTPAINTIYHIVGTYNGTTATLYVNGVSVGTGTPTSNIVASIARINNASGSFFNGYIQEVAWYSTALTSTQVSNHYNVGIAVNSSLSLVSAFSPIYAADLNQVITVLQQPAGGQEKGKYHLGGNGYALNALVDCNIYSISRQNSTPVSATIDTVDQAPSGINAPTLAAIKPGGIGIKSTSTGAVAGCNCGGNWTLNF